MLRDNLLFRMSDDDWDTVMDIHLKGSFLMSRACQKHMVDQKFGRIVNLSSSSALGNRGQANYSAAKAGLQGFTKTLAIELGQFGITANAVAPGFIATDMTAATAARVGVDFEDFKKGAAANIPVRRVGDLLHRPGAGPLVQVKDGHGHPVRGQPARGGGTDAAGRAGHDRDSLCHLGSSLLTP